MNNIQITKLCEHLTIVISQNLISEYKRGKSKSKQREKKITIEKTMAN